MLAGDAENNLAAVALVRAAVADDPDAGLLVMSEHGALDNRATSHFIMSLAAVAGRALLAANGFNVEKTVQVLSRWSAEYAEDAEALR